MFDESTFEYLDPSVFEVIDELHINIDEDMKTIDISKENKILHQWKDKIYMEKGERVNERLCNSSRF